MAVNTIYTSVLSADRSLLDDSGKHALPWEPCWCWVLILEQNIRLQ
jgi:hypothetical protein